MVQELLGAVLGDFARGSCLSDCRSHLCFSIYFFYTACGATQKHILQQQTHLKKQIKKERKGERREYRNKSPLSLYPSLSSRLAFSIFYIEKLGLINYKTSDGHRSNLMCMRLCLFLASFQQQSSGVRCITSFQKSIRADF